MAEIPGIPWSVTIPLRLRSAANLREHWTAKHRRVKREREEVSLALRAEWGTLIFGLNAPVRITMTRIAPRAATRPLDGDNLQAAFKATRDAIARWCGTEDNDPLITWQYTQERGNPGEYAIRITMEEHAL